MQPCIILHHFFFAFSLLYLVPFFHFIFAQWAFGMKTICFFLSFYFVASWACCWFVWLLLVVCCSSFLCCFSFSHVIWDIVRVVWYAFVLVCTARNVNRKNCARKSLPHQTNHGWWIARCPGKPDQKPQKKLKTHQNNNKQIGTKQGTILCTVISVAAGNRASTKQHWCRVFLSVRPKVRWTKDFFFFFCFADCIFLTYTNNARTHAWDNDLATIIHHAILYACFYSRILFHSPISYALSFICKSPVCLTILSAGTYISGRVLWRI